MRTTREEVIASFKMAQKTKSAEWKERSIRYYLEKDGTFELPAGITVDPLDYLDPDSLLDRLIRELEEATVREDKEYADYIANLPPDEQER